MHLGRAILSLRKDRGWSQKRLAREIGHDHSYVSHLEAGNRVPSMGLLTSIADALDVPVWLIMFLASGEHNLNGIDAGTAEELGGLLRQVLLEARGGGLGTDG